MERIKGNENTEQHNKNGRIKDKSAQKLYIDVARKFRAGRSDNGWTIIRNNGVVRAEHIGLIDKGIPQEVILVQFTNPIDSRAFRQVNISITRFKEGLPDSRTEMNMFHIAGEDPRFSYVTCKTDTNTGAVKNDDLSKDKVVPEFKKTISNLP